MTHPHHTDLLAEIADFCAAVGMSKAAFGKAALGDPRFVYDLERGKRQCLPRTVGKVRDFISTHVAGDAA